MTAALTRLEFLLCCDGGDCQRPTCSTILVPGCKSSSGIELGSSTMMYCTSSSPADITLGTKPMLYTTRTRLQCVGCEDLNKPSSVTSSCPYCKSACPLVSMLRRGASVSTVALHGSHATPRHEPAKCTANRVERSHCCDAIMLQLQHN